MTATVFSSTAFPGGMPRTLPILRSINEVAQLADTLNVHGVHTYVRYSLGPDADVFLPGSVNHQERSAHPGLSFVDITPPGARVRSYVAKKLRWFSYLLWEKPQTVPWLARGREVGRGAEGEPLLVDIEPLAYCDMRAIVEALWMADDEFVGKRIALEIIDEKVGTGPSAERTAELARFGMKDRV